MAGWAYSWLVGLELTTNAWTAPVDARRRQPWPAPDHSRHPGPAHRRPAARPQQGTQDLVAVVDRPSGQIPDPDLLRRSYTRRFDIEHTFHFARQTLN